MAQTVGQQYIDAMSGAKTAPATVSDYQAEAERLSFLVPETPRATIYDLASDLSAGLAAQAASGQPASIGYGLAAGFNKFSDGAALRRKEREKYKQELMQTAYASVEKKRAEQQALAEKAATYQFEVDIENAKKGAGGIFGDLNSVEGRALDFLARLKQNPNLAITNKSEMDTEKAYLASKFKTVTIDGEVQAVPVYDVDRLFPETKAQPAPGTKVEGGVTYTLVIGKSGPNGEPVYRSPDGVEGVLN